MADIVIMPKQGLLMETGTITEWLVQEGGQVTAGEPLFEMETDKLTITMNAEVTGTMLKIVHGVGDEVPITEMIAIVGQPGEDISALLGGAAPAAEEAPAVVAIERAPGEKVQASPRAKLRAEENGIDIAKVPGSGPEGFVIERDVNAFKASQPAVTPLAAKTAVAEGISLDGITGTGANGKITTADLPTSAPAAAPSAPAAEAPAAVPAGRGSRKVKMNGMEKAVMKNMLASKTTNAQTSHRMTVDMTEVMALRKKLKALDIKVSFNDIIMRACAKALQDYPIINASTAAEEQAIVYHDYVNIGIAVSVNGGLIVPVIKDADICGLQGIAEQSAALIEKARNNALAPDDYHGGTFTVSSLGMFDLDDFVAIINPPESGILAVGKIAKTPVVVTNADGVDEIVIKPMCALSLSYDHRIINGAEAAKFLQKVKAYLQTPLLLI